MNDRTDTEREQGGNAGTSDAARIDSAPIGLDVGTSKVLTARGTGKRATTAWQLNAFMAVPYSPLSQTTLQKNDIPYYREGDSLVVYGTAAQKFASMFNAECRRPMSKGVLNPREPAAAHVLETILGSLVGTARTPGELIAFSVPAASTETSTEITYHEETIKHYLISKNYKPLAVNEGLAVVLAELDKENFTGIGISCGGGMCNVALSYLSIPAMTFSISKGGDYIDSAVGAVVNEPSTRIKVIKEESLDLSRPASDKVEKALHIYYDELIQALVKSLAQSLSRSDHLPRSDQPLSLVLAGGTAKPRGFRERFEDALRNCSLPIQISSVRMSSDPQTATARGALVAVQAEL